MVTRSFECSWLSVSWSWYRSLGFAFVLICYPCVQVARASPCFSSGTSAMRCTIIVRVSIASRSWRRVRRDETRRNTSEIASRGQRFGCRRYLVQYQPRNDASKEAGCSAHCRDVPSVGEERPYSVHGARDLHCRCLGRTVFRSREISSSRHWNAAGGRRNGQVSNPGRAVFECSSSNAPDMVGSNIVVLSWFTGECHLVSVRPEKPNDTWQSTSADLHLISTNGGPGN